MSKPLKPNCLDKQLCPLLYTQRIRVYAKVATYQRVTLYYLAQAIASGYSGVAYSFFRVAS